MARVTKNLLLQGLSGKIGGLVVRQVGSQTIVQAAPNPARRAPASPRQLAQRARMYEAQRYAKAQLRDPAARARYATRIDERRTSAYTVADYMNPPRVEAIQAHAYHGQPGDVLRIAATDDFAVASVHVRIFAPAGQLFEEGPAQLQPTGLWHYRAQAPHPTLSGTRLEAEARDYPGHAATLTLVL